MSADTSRVAAFPGCWLVTSTVWNAMVIQRILHLKFSYTLARAQGSVQRHSPSPNVHLDTGVSRGFPSPRPARSGLPFGRMILSQAIDDLASWGFYTLSVALHNGFRFLQLPLPAGPSPFLAVRIPPVNSRRGPSGLPCSRASTFSSAFRQELSPGGTTNDKAVKKKHRHLSAYLLVPAYSATFRRS